MNQTSLKVVETDDRTLEGGGDGHKAVAGIGVNLAGLVVLLFNGIIGWGLGINVLNLHFVVVCTSPRQIAFLHGQQRIVENGNAFFEGIIRISNVIDNGVVLIIPSQKVLGFSKNRNVLA